MHRPGLGRLVRSGRLLCLLAAALVALAGCSEAPELQIIPTNRVVLVEFFTFVRCVYCPYAAHALDSLAEEFADSLVVIAYHRRVAGDTLCPEYVETRRRLYYDSGGEPATVFDGGDVIRTSGPEHNYETFRNYILAARSVTPKAQLSLEATLATGTGTVRVRATGVDSTPVESLRLFIVVQEDSVRTCPSGATDSVFNGVMRQMLPDENGTRVSLLKGDTLVVEETFPIKEFWNRSMLGAVAFVQDMTTRKILQTAFCRRFEEQRR